MEQQVTTGALLREVARLHTHLQRANVACCAGTTITQCTLLTELGRSGPIPLAELARRIGFDKSWTSRAVEHLVQDSLIEKAHCLTKICLWTLHKTTGTRSIFHLCNEITSSLMLLCKTHGSCSYVPTSADFS